MFAIQSMFNAGSRGFLGATMFCAHACSGRVRREVQMTSVCKDAPDLIYRYSTSAWRNVSIEGKSGYLEAENVCCKNEDCKLRNVRFFNAPYHELARFFAQLALAGVLYAYTAAHLSNFEFVGFMLLDVLSASLELFALYYMSVETKRDWADKGIPVFALFAELPAFAKAFFSSTPVDMQKKVA